MGAKKSNGVAPQASAKSPATTTQTSSTTKPTTSPPQTGRLSRAINYTLLSTLIATPLIFPTASHAAFQGAKTDIAEWQSYIQAVQSDPAAVAQGHYEDVLSRITQLTANIRESRLTEQQKLWAEAGDRDVHLETKVTVKPTTTSAVATKDKAHPPSAAPVKKKRVQGATIKEDKPAAAAAAAAGVKKEKKDALSNDNETPTKKDKDNGKSEEVVGDVIANLLAAFNAKPKRESSGLDMLNAKAKETKKDKSAKPLSDDQLDLADSVAGIVGFLGKLGEAIQDNTKDSPVKTSEMEEEEERVVVAKKEVKEKVKKSSVADEPVVVEIAEEMEKVEVTKRPNAQSKAKKDDGDIPPAAAAVGEILNAFGKWSSGELTASKAAKEETAAVNARKDSGANVGDLVGLLGMLGNAAGSANKGKSGSSGAGGGGGGGDLLGLLGALGNSGSKTKTGATGSSGGGADMFKLLGALGSTLGNSNKDKSKEGGVGGADLMNLLGALTGSGSVPAGAPGGGRANAAGPNGAGTGLDIGTTVQMMKLMGTFSNLGKTIQANSQEPAGSGDASAADGSATKSKSAAKQGNDMGDIFGAGIEALSMFSKLMAANGQAQLAKKDASEAIVEELEVPEVEESAHE